MSRPERKGLLSSRQQEQAEQQSVLELPENKKIKKKVVGVKSFRISQYAADVVEQCFFDAKGKYSTRVEAFDEIIRVYEMYKDDYPKKLK